MDKIKDIVTTALHTLGHEKVHEILTALVHLGVETEADLEYIVEDDLKDFLKPIQFRKLIAAFKCSNPSSPQANVPLNHTREILLQEAYSSAVNNVQKKNSLPTCSSKESDPQVIVPKVTALKVPLADSGNKWVKLRPSIVHWEKMPATLIAALHSGKVLEASSRQQIVNLIADDIMKVIRKPKLHEINIIAKDIVKQFKSLADITGDLVGSCGYSILSSQIVSSIDNLKRETLPTNKQLSVVANTMTKMLEDACVKLSVKSVDCRAVKQKHGEVDDLNSVSGSRVSYVPGYRGKTVTVLPDSKTNHESSELQSLKNIVKWERMPGVLMKALQSGNALNKEERYEMVTLITNDILDVIKQPTPSELDLIAEDIVNRYKSLEDRIAGLIVGSGHDFLCNQIAYKIAHLKRKSVPSSKPCVDAVPSTEAQIPEPETTICLNKQTNISTNETEDARLKDLNKSLCVNSHELETSLAQKHSDANSPETLREKRNLLCSATKRFVIGPCEAKNSVGSQFNRSLLKTSVSCLSSKKETALSQDKSEIFINVTTTPPPSLDNIVNWDKIPVAIMTALQTGNALKHSFRRELVHLIADDILRVMPKPRRKEVYVIAKSCVKKYKNLEDKIESSLITNSCDLLFNQIITRIDTIRRKKSVRLMKKRQSASDVGYGCSNWLPEFPLSETEESLEVKRKALFELTKFSPISSCELERLITDTYFCQRRAINFHRNVSTVLSEWPLLFSDTGMMVHFKLLTGINLREQLRNELVLKGKQLLNFLCSISQQKVVSCLQTIMDIQNNTSYSEIFALLMLLSSYFEEDIASLVIMHEVNGSSESDNVNVPRFPCLVGIGPSLLFVDHFLLVCDGVIVNKVIKEDLTALSMLFASYFVLNCRYPKCNRNLLEFIQRCLAGINPPNGSKVDGGKTYVNRTIMKLWDTINDSKFMVNSGLTFSL